jgi:hypothetical protein
MPAKIVVWKKQDLAQPLLAGVNGLLRSGWIISLRFIFQPPLAMTGSRGNVFVQNAYFHPQPIAVVAMETVAVLPEELTYEQERGKPMPSKNHAIIQMNGRGGGVGGGVSVKVGDGYFSKLKSQIS